MFWCEILLLHLGISLRSLEDYFMEEEGGGCSLEMEGGNAQGPVPHGWLLMSSALAHCKLYHLSSFWQGCTHLVVSEELSFSLVTALNLSSKIQLKQFLGACNWFQSSNYFVLTGVCMWSVSCRSFLWRLTCGKLLCFCKWKINSGTLVNVFQSLCEQLIILNFILFFVKTFKYQALCEGCVKAVI